ncbi:MAG: ATP-binding protein [Vibrio sp.]
MKLKEKITLTLIRGLPGSGKSTLAAKLADESDAIHLETDMFFVDKTGDYTFDGTQLPQAHEWCQQETESYLRQGYSVIVSNTFVQQWEMQSYKDIAERLNIHLEVKVCRNDFGTIHDIDSTTLLKMKEKWQE